MNRAMTNKMRRDTIRTNVTRCTPICLVSVLALAATAAAQPVVTVTGGHDETGQTYEWRITHQHPAPLTHVEVPHFRGDRFYAPPGWSAEVRNRNSLDFQTGMCVADAGDAGSALHTGDVGTFKLHINSAGAPWGQGEMLLRFADGTEARVVVDVPVKRQSPIEPFATPLALGAMFAIFLLVRVLRNKRRAKP